MQFEFAKVVMHQLRIDDFIGALNAMGAEGWALTQIIEEFGHKTAIMQREKTKG